MVNIKVNADMHIGDLEFIGKGTQGKVYKIDSQRCIKIFKSNKVCKAELTTLLIAKGDKHIPILYNFGKNYIIREYVNGIELNQYLLNQRLTPEISRKLVELYDAMVRIGYSRLDSAIFHIFVLPTGDLKLIDTSKALKKESTIPSLIISGLEELGYKEDFLNFVKSTRPDLYNHWINYSKKNYKKKQ